MILRILKEPPEKKARVGKRLIAVGLLILPLGIAWSRLKFLPGHVAPGWNDFAHGTVLGLAIGLEILGLLIGSSAARAKRL